MVLFDDDGSDSFKSAAQKSSNCYSRNPLDCCHSIAHKLLRTYIKNSKKGKLDVQCVLFIDALKKGKVKSGVFRCFTVF
jgi:hypothetical protein